MAKAGRTTTTGTTKTAEAEKDFSASAVEGEKDHGNADDQVAVATDAESGDAGDSGAPTETLSEPAKPAAVGAAVITCEDVLKRPRAGGRDL